MGNEGKGEEGNKGWGKRRKMEPDGLKGEVRGGEGNVREVRGTWGNWC